MKTFKDYLSESADNIKGEELLNKIGKTRMRAMTKHPFWDHYIRPYAYMRNPVYMHSKGSLGHQVHAAADNHTMVRFDFYNYKVTNAHLFKWDGTSRSPSGRKMWEWKKSHIEDE